MDESSWIGRVVHDGGAGDCGEDGPVPALEGEKTD